MAQPGVEKGSGIEKDPTSMMEDVEQSPTKSSYDTDYESEFTEQEQRKIIHRIDRRLVVTVGVLYCISLMDRTNLSAAAVAGMNAELSLLLPFPAGSTVSRYSVVTLVFFTTYIVFQPPSTVLIRKLGPRVHLSVITTLWGAVMIGMGFVKDWQSLAGLRVVLGILEAGFFPSVVYLLSTWYTRYDIGKRYSVFYMLGSLASACAGILAYGLMQLGGKAGSCGLPPTFPCPGHEGLTGWRWIFIIEGALTCALGIGAYLALVDFPDKAHKSWRFLTEQEAKFIIARVDRDRGDAKPEPFAIGKFFRAALDIKIWGYAMIFFNTTTVTYALAYFLPIILNSKMGYSVGASQCLVAPPYAFAAIIMYATGWAGDRYKMRGPIIILNMVICLVGLPIMGFAEKASVQYFGVFLTTAGANSNIPASMSYQANNIRGQWKRAFCSATLVGFGGIGGIAGGLVFRTQDSPDYEPGIYACIACCLLSILIVGGLTLQFRRANAKAERGEIELEDSDEDHQRGFRYTI